MKESAIMYKHTLFNREEAQRILDEDEAIIRAMEIAELELKAKIRESEKEENKGVEFNIESFKFDQNSPVDLSSILGHLKTIDPKLYDEAKRVNNVEGAVAFVRDHQGRSVCVCVCVLSVR